jgi:hypothetical protein
MTADPNQRRVSYPKRHGVLPQVLQSINQPMCSRLTSPSAIAPAAVSVVTERGPMRFLPVERHLTNI